MRTTEQHYTHGIPSQKVRFHIISIFIPFISPPIVPSILSLLPVSLPHRIFPCIPLPPYPSLFLHLSSLPIYLSSHPPSLSIFPFPSISLCLFFTCRRRPTSDIFKSHADFLSLSGVFVSYVDFNSLFFFLLNFTILYFSSISHVVFFYSIINFISTFLTQLSTMAIL